MSHAPPPPRPTHVLVVDDSATSRALIRVHLMGHELEFHEASSGDEAMRVLGSTDIDLVILDYNMPDKDGLGVTRAIRSHERATVRALPIIMLTANKAADLPARARKEGVTEVVQKPVTSSNLVPALELALHRA